MGRGISISYAEPVRLEGVIATSWRVVITASDGVDMPDEIFLFQRVYADDAHTTTVDQLMTVCTPFDLTTFPIDDPTVGQSPPFFRKAVIDVMVPTLDAADYMWARIQEAVCDLKEQMDRLDTLVGVETVRCGDDLEDSESVSESL